VRDEMAGVASIASIAGRLAAQLADLELYRAGDTVQAQLTARQCPIATQELHLLGVESHLREALHVEPVA